MEHKKKWQTKSTVSCSVHQLIINMKKLLDSDWLREVVQFKCNTSAKGVTHRNSEL